MTSRVESVCNAKWVRSNINFVRPTKSAGFAASCGCLTSTFGFGFLASETWNPVTDKFGALAPIYGTVVAALIAMVISLRRKCTGDSSGIQSRTPTRVGVRPVMIAVREGEQLACAA